MLSIQFVMYIVQYVNMYECLRMKFLPEVSEGKTLR